MMRSWVSSMVLAAFMVNTFVPPTYAQVVLPPPQGLVALSPAVHPPVLTGVKVYAKDPFRFDFILDKGDEGETLRAASLHTTALHDASLRLVKYFLAALTVPASEMWVNLSPYEKDRIVPEAFGRTEMGRDLLAQDYLLKQITSSLMYPGGELGKKFWAEVYRQAREKFGTTDIPVDTFNKVWIVPAKAVVYEKPKAADNKSPEEAVAYVVEARLKVMLESDYVAMSHQKDMAESPALTGDLAEGHVQMEPSPSRGGMGRGEDVAKTILRQVIIPALEKEVNEGKNFAQLRQVYNSLVLATWYKKKVIGAVKGSPLGFYVGQNKVQGVNIDDPKEAEKIWSRYVEAFRKGAYNFVREEYDPATRETIPRKYFAGGVQIVPDLAMTGHIDAAALPLKDLLLLEVRGDGIPADGDSAQNEGWAAFSRTVDSFSPGAGEALLAYLLEHAAVDIDREFRPRKMVLGTAENPGYWTYPVIDKISGILNDRQKDALARHLVTHLENEPALLYCLAKLGTPYAIRLVLEKIGSAVTNRECYISAALFMNTVAGYPVRRRKDFATVRDRLLPSEQALLRDVLRRRSLANVPLAYAGVFFPGLDDVSIGLDGTPGMPPGLSPASGWRFRIWDPDRADDLQKISGQMYLIASRSFSNEDLPAREGIERSLRNQRTRVFLVEDGKGSLGGFAVVRMRDDGSAVLDIIVVDQEFRAAPAEEKSSAGFGSAILDRVRRDLGTMGISSFRYFPSRNNNAQGFYENYARPESGRGVTISISTENHDFSYVMAWDLPPGDGQGYQGDTALPDGVVSDEQYDAAMMEGLESPDKGVKLAERIEAVVSQEAPAAEDHKEYVRLLEIGTEILDGYRHYRTREGRMNYLNEQGENILAGMTNFLEKAKSGDFVWTIEPFEELKGFLKSIPTVLHPHEELLIDVLAGFTEAQLKVLAVRKFSFPITQGCRNQCAMCAASKSKGPIVSMPFPILSHVLHKMKKYGYVWTPYFNTDALDYYDGFVGASAADVFRRAHQLGRKTSLVTNGSGLSAATEKVIGSMKKEWISTFRVSLHAFYQPVVEYVLNVHEKKIGAEERDRLRRHIVSLYSGKYISLFNALSRAGINFIVSAYLLERNDIFEILQQNGQLKAFEVLKEIDAINKEIREKVEPVLFIGGVEPDLTRVGWWGDAALLLESLGVDVKTMGLIAGDRRNSILGEPYDLHIGIDGRIQVAIEGGSSHVARLQDMFSDPDSRGFCLLIDHFRRTLGIGTSWTIDNIGDELKAGILTQVRQAFPNTAIEEDQISFIEPQTPFKGVLELLFADEGMKALLEYPSSANRHALYDRLKDIPVPLASMVRVGCTGVHPRWMEYVNVALKWEEINGLPVERRERRELTPETPDVGTFYRMSAEWQLLARDKPLLFQYYKLPLMAFQARPGEVDGNLDAGYVRQQPDPSQSDPGLQARSDKPVKALVFDLADTLHVSEAVKRLKVDALVQFCLRNKEGITEAEVRDKYAALDSLSGVVKYFGLDMGAFNKAIDDLDITDAGLSPNDDLLALLEHLRQSYYLVLASNASDAHVRQVLQKLGLDQVFDRVYTQGGMGVGKPDMKFFSNIVAALGFPPEAVVSIGGSLEKEVNAARAAGLKAVHVQGVEDLLTNVVAGVDEINTSMQEADPAEIGSPIGTTPTLSAAQTPYLDEININRSYGKLDDHYGHQLTRLIIKLIFSKFVRSMKTGTVAPVKILFLGVGQGFEAIEAKRKFGKFVEVHAINKEPGLFYDQEGVLRPTGPFGAAHQRSFQAALEHVKRNLRIADLDEGMPSFNMKFDLVVSGLATVPYLKDKIGVMNNILELYCAEGGYLLSFLSGLVQLSGYFLEDHYDSYGVIAEAVQQYNENKKTLVRFFNRLSEQNVNIRVHFSPKDFDLGWINVRKEGKQRIPLKFLASKRVPRDEFPRQYSFYSVEDVTPGGTEGVDDGAEAVQVSVDGGIDLAPVGRVLAVGAADGGGFFHFDPAALEKYRDTVGMAPVVIAIRPVEDLAGFLGVR